MKKKAQSSNLLKPLIILGLVVLGVVTWYSLPHPVPIDINYVGNESGTVTMTLTPTHLTLEPNVESTLTLNLDAGSSHVTAAQVEIPYDPAKVGTPIVTQGDFLTGVLASVKTENNKITFTFSVPPADGGKSGSGTLATIKIKPPIVGVSELSFGDVSAVTTTEALTNMLKSATGSTITVAVVGGASTSPSPSITASPSLTPSVTPSPAGERPAKPTGLRSNCHDSSTKITFRWDSAPGITSYKFRLDQKDGNDDKSVDDIPKTEYDTTIKANQKYSWWVHSTQDGLDSEATKIDEVVCEKLTLNTSTPTPTPIPTPKASIKKLTASPKATATPSATPIPPIQYPINQDAGSLNDVFTNPNIVETQDDLETTFENKNFWQRLIEWLSNLFVPN